MGADQQAITPRLLILWHSRTGAARAMARAARAGAARATGCEARLIPVSRATPEVLLGADGYIFVAPENLGALSGAMKDMLDKAYYPLLSRLEGRAYGSIIAAGSDGMGALAQLDRIVTGWRLRRVAEPLVFVMGAQTKEAILAPKVVPAAMLAQCRELGQAMAEGLAAGIF
jgi:multimeric flavodoxin WrbA